MPPCNLVVIGAGTAGLITTAGAAGLGAKVALIEKNTRAEIASALPRAARVQEALSDQENSRRV